MILFVSCPDKLHIFDLTLWDIIHPHSFDIQDKFKIITRLGLKFTYIFYLETMAFIDTSEAISSVITEVDTRTKSSPVGLFADAHLNYEPDGVKSFPAQYGLLRTSIGKEAITSLMWGGEQLAETLTSMVERVIKYPYSTLSPSILFIENGNEAQKLGITPEILMGSYHEVLKETSECEPVAISADLSNIPLIDLIDVMKRSLLPKNMEAYVAGMVNAKNRSKDQAELAIELQKIFPEDSNKVASEILELESIMEEIDKSYGHFLEGSRILFLINDTGNEKSKLGSSGELIKAILKGNETRKDTEIRQEKNDWRRTLIALSRVKFGVFSNNLLLTNVAQAIPDINDSRKYDNRVAITRRIFSFDSSRILLIAKKILRNAFQAERKNGRYETAKFFNESKEMIAKETVDYIQQFLEEPNFIELTQMALWLRINFGKDLKVDPSKSRVENLKDLKFSFTRNLLLGYWGMLETEIDGLSRPEKEFLYESIEKICKFLTYPEVNASPYNVDSLREVFDIQNDTIWKEILNFMSETIMFNMSKDNQNAWRVQLKPFFVDAFTRISTVNYVFERQLISLREHPEIMANILLSETGKVLMGKLRN